MGTKLTAASHSASVHAWSASGPRDLSRMLRRARRHSAHVRTLRKAIPTGAAFGLMAIALVAWLKPLSAIPELPVTMDNLVVQGTKITMEAPKLTGFTRDNRAYKVTAEAAAQDVTNPTILELSGIKGTMEMQSKATVDVTAVAGLYDTKSELLTLSQHIHVISSDGYEGFLTEASIEMRQNQMTSEKPVEILLPTGKLNANRMDILNNGELMRFDGGTRLTLKPSAPPPPPKPAPKTKTAGKKKGAPAPAEAPAATMQGFTLKREQPVQITSTTLEVRDKEKRATFIGNVVVVQGETTMKAALLDVFYDQDNDPAATPSLLASASGAAGPGGNTQIRKLEAKGGVVVTQKDQTATGEMSIFDMKNNTVTFVGGVVMTQGPQIIRGDRLTTNLTTGESLVQGGERGVQATFIQGKPGDDKPAAKPAAPPPGSGPPNALQGFSLNRGVPVQVNSANLEVHDKQRRAIFTGNVIVGQGDTTMKSKTLEAFYDQDEDPSAPTMAMGANGNTQLRRLEAKGGVVVTQKDQTATGEMGIFEVKQNTVTLIGGVVVTQGQQVLRGERLTVDLTNGVSHFEGGGRGVQMLAYPNQMKRGEHRSADGNQKPEEHEARNGDARPADTRPPETRAEPARKGAARPAARSTSGEPLRLN
jgi:lipopolysaccharide export system protein LptC